MSAESTMRGDESVGTDSEPSEGLYGSDTGANMVVAAAAELIGTFVLVFCGTAVAVAATVAAPTAGAPYDSLAVALAFGLALVAVVAALGHISGAHVNPAVTLGLAITGRFPWTFVPAYLLTQLGGAMLAALAVWVTYGGPARSEATLGATFPFDGVGILRAVIVEALVTFVLVFVVVAVATDKRAAPAVAPLAVGFALTTGVLIAGPVTGGAEPGARARAHDRRRRPDQLLGLRPRARAGRRGSCPDLRPLHRQGQCARLARAPNALAWSC